MLLVRRGRFLEDFTAGDIIVHRGPRTVTDGDRALYMGLTGSRAILPAAATIATAVGLRAAPIEDMLVFNIAFGASVADISVNAVANLGYADARFHRMVYAGDTLSVASDVLAVKENASGASGVVHVRTSARNQNLEPVLSYVRWVMIRKDPDGRRTVTRSPVPDLPATVPPEALEPFAIARADALLAATGDGGTFDDYAIGDRIGHPGVMTINDSDHSIATRLYQNNARAHFDGLGMRDTPMGQRLVYGGHVISICRALSHDGFENGLGMLAINAGRHVNPTFAGDTICCATQVVDRYPLSATQGALRLRLIGAKDLASPADIAFPDTPVNDTAARDHGETVVLDFDYTLALPRRV